MIRQVLDNELDRDEDQIEATAQRVKPPVAGFVLRLTDALFATSVACLMALALGLPIIPALALGLGTGLLASTLCSVARRSGPTVTGILVGGLVAAVLAASVGLEAWLEIALVVSASLAAARLGRRVVLAVATP
ncbi:MAG: hypothetical protein Kilf2KO_47670 [Rhodospirillales bacterium]